MTIHDVKAACHAAFICQQTNAYTRMLQLSREYLTQCMDLGMGSVGSLTSVLRIIPQNDNVRDHKNSNYSLDIKRILVDVSCYNKEPVIIHEHLTDQH